MSATGRTKKTGVDYFSHDVNASSSSKTIFALERQFGNDGYAFWFKLLELLGMQPEHYYDCGDEADWIFLVAKTNVDEISATEILDLLARMRAIDPELWKQKVIWCQNFVDRLTEVYRKRGVAPPHKPEVHNFCDRNTTTTCFSASESTQSKVKKSKVNKSKEKPAAEEDMCARRKTPDGKPVPSGTCNVPPLGSESAVSQPSIEHDASGEPSSTDVPSSGVASAVLQSIAEAFDLKGGQKYALLQKKYNQWSETFTDDVLEIALREALEHGAKTVKYIDAVLTNWQKQGLTEADKIQAHLDNFKQHKRQTSHSMSQKNFAGEERDLNFLIE